MKNKFVDFKVLATSLCCSVVMGLISFAFLKCLDYAADFRSFFPLCYIFLPVAGIVTAFVYKRIGGKSSMGNNIIIESANDGEKVPKRLASLTFIFTCITHLFGGSVGREGTAVQIGGSLTSNVISALKIITEVQSFSAESALHSVRFSAHRLQVHFSEWKSAVSEDCRQVR